MYKRLWREGQGHEIENTANQFGTQEMKCFTCLTYNFIDMLKAF